METSALSFGQPWVLNFLWLLPPVAALFWWAERRRRALIGRIVAPKLRAPSSSVFKSIEDITASTERIMNGSVNNTWPTKIKSQLVRKPPELPLAPAPPEEPLPPVIVPMT
jgi:hypothetical protein